VSSLKLSTVLRAIGAATFVVAGASFWWKAGRIPACSTVNYCGRRGRCS